MFVPIFAKYSISVLFIWQHSNSKKKKSFASEIAIDEMQKKSDHSRGRQIPPCNYVKLIEEADKAFDLLGTENPALRDDVDINTLLAQIHGTLAAESKALTTETGPRVSTQFVGRVINDTIPIFMDGIFFKVNVHEPNKAAKINRKTTRQ